MEVFFVVKDFCNFVTISTKSFDAGLDFRLVISPEFVTLLPGGMDSRELVLNQQKNVINECKCFRNSISKGSLERDNFRKVRLELERSSC